MKEKKSSDSKKPRSLFEMKDNMELLKQLEDFTPQGFVGGNGGGSQAHGDVLTEHGDVCRGVIEDGEELKDMPEEEEEEILAIQCGENQMVGEDDSLLIYQAGRRGTPVSVPDIDGGQS